MERQAMAGLILSCQKPSTCSTPDVNQAMTLVTICEVIKISQIWSNLSLGMRYYVDTSEEATY